MVLSSQFVLRASVAGEYGDYFVIEGGNDEDGFVCYAWEERGLSELCGPFESRAEALAVLESEREYLEWCGFAVG